MSALPWIAGGLALGGLYLWYKQRAGASSKPEEDSCAVACRLSGPYCIDGGASCRATNAVLAALSPFHDSSEMLTGEVANTRKINDALNGEIEVTNALAHGATTVLTGSVLKYKSGCQPYAYAPGFSKCKPGTLDEYISALQHRAGVDFPATEQDNVTEEAFTTVAARLAYEAKHQDLVDSASHWYELNVSGTQHANVFEHVVKEKFMTGAAGDPTTVGPWANTTGGAFWMVRGKRVDCPSGQAPKAIVYQAYQRDPSALTDDDARAPVPIDQDPAVVHTQLGCVGTSAPPGFTWKAGGWKRLAAGEVPNPGPCASSSSSSGTGGQLATFVFGEHT